MLTSFRSSKTPWTICTSRAERRRADPRRGHVFEGNNDKPRLPDLSGVRGTFHTAMTNYSPCYDTRKEPAVGIKSGANFAGGLLLIAMAGDAVLLQDGRLRKRLSHFKAANQEI